MYNTERSDMAAYLVYETSGDDAGIQLIDQMSNTGMVLQHNLNVVRSILYPMYLEVHRFTTKVSLPLLAPSWPKRWLWRASANVEAC